MPDYQNPPRGGSYLRKPDGSLEVLETPGMEPPAEQPEPDNNDEEEVGGDATA